MLWRELEYFKKKLKNLLEIYKSTKAPNDTENFISVSFGAFYQAYNIHLSDDFFISLSYTTIFIYKCNNESF